MFTARYALSPYIKQTLFALKGLRIRFNALRTKRNRLYSKTQAVPCSKHYLDYKN